MGTGDALFYQDPPGRHPKAPRAARSRASGSASIAAKMPFPPASEDQERFRESSRAPLEIAVSLQVDAFEEPLSGLTANLSIGGMFVASRVPRPVGTLARFELELAGSPVRGTAEVTWIRARAQGPGRPAGMGLQFRFIEEGGHDRVRAAVLQRLEQLGLPAEPDVGPEVLARRRAPAKERPAPARVRSAPRQRTSADRRGHGEAAPGPRRPAVSDATKRWVVTAILVGLLLLLVARLAG